MKSVRLQVICGDITKQQAQTIVNTLYLAMLGLEDEYEDYIEVTITEE